MRTQLRIVAGTLRGRRLSCTVNDNLRPTPQMVREALFSILGHAVPDRPFFDVFAGTGVVGLEALSRGASLVTFVERDFRLVEELERHARTFGVADRARMARADVYRWVERWRPPAEPVTVFLSPPFADFDRRLDEFLQLVRTFQARLPPDSVLVVQSERDAPLAELPDWENWDVRHYGRNELLIWVTPSAEPDEETGREDTETGRQGDRKAGGRRHNRALRPGRRGRESLLVSVSPCLSVRQPGRNHRAHIANRAQLRPRRGPQPARSRARGALGRGLRARRTARPAPPGL